MKHVYLRLSCVYIEELVALRRDEDNDILCNAERCEHFVFKYCTPRWSMQCAYIHTECLIN